MNTLNCGTLVVGAGMSGITASVELLKAGHDDLLIIEALDRRGGRMHTIQVGERHIEIGAQWIHGQVDNPVFEIAKANGLLEEGFEKIEEQSSTVSFEYAPPDLDAFKELLVEPDVKSEEMIYFLNGNGAKINPKISIALYRIAEETLDGFYETEPSLEARKVPGDRRFVDVFREEFKKNVDAEMGPLLKQVQSLENSAQILKQFEEIVNSIFYTRCRLEALISGCQDICDFSFKNCTAYRVFDGNSYTELKYGYKAVLDAIIRPQKEKFYERLRLNHHLKRIYVCQKLLPRDGAYNTAECEHCRFTSDQNKVVVSVQDRSKEPRDFLIICDRVLCTVSLGYLKKNVNTLFEPLNLVDDAKRSAIVRMGFGTANKIYFFYDTGTEAFWNDCGENVELTFCPKIDVSDPHDLSPLITSTWMDTISCASAVYQRKDCLSFWVSGNDTEGLSDQVLSTELTALLRRSLKNDAIPEPKSIIRSAWSSHPNFRGSYSYTPIGTISTEPDELARPLPSTENPKVLFAGEHTHNLYFSTVHGAHLSGLRESARILGKQE